MPETTFLKPVIMKDLQGFFTEKQRFDMYSECETNRDKLLIRLLWKSGRRVSELLQIKGKDIDFENKRILWTILKKKKLYKAWKPIDRKTLQLLGFYLQEEEYLNDENYLFYTPGNFNKPISRTRVYQLVRKIAAKAGIKKVGNSYPHPHHFRHSMVIDLAQKMKSPADIRKLQMFMEHANLSVTETYLQFADEEMQSLIED